MFLWMYWGFFISKMEQLSGNPISPRINKVFPFRKKRLEGPILHEGTFPCMLSLYCSICRSYTNTLKAHVHWPTFSRIHISYKNHVLSMIRLNWKFAPNHTANRWSRAQRSGALPWKQPGALTVQLSHCAQRGKKGECWQSRLQWAAVSTVLLHHQTGYHLLKGGRKRK